jgi:hypothetical protein
MLLLKYTRYAVAAFLKKQFKPDVSDLNRLSEKNNLFVFGRCSQRQDADFTVSHH